MPLFSHIFIIGNLFLPKEIAKLQILEIYISSNRRRITILKYLEKYHIKENPPMWTLHSPQYNGNI